jgi:DNA-directed RNA polymerase specialized sigma24 family protein
MMPDTPPGSSAASAEGSSGRAASAPAANKTTQVFNAHRELLFSIVYNMLGSVADTEDVLQETWLSWTSRNLAPSVERIENPRAYLVRIAVNQALTHQDTISRRRETYVGPWLPEPLVSPLTDTPISDDAAVRAESVSMALLVVMETLSLHWNAGCSSCTRCSATPTPRSQKSSAAVRRRYASSPTARASTSTPDAPATSPTCTSASK